MIFVVEVPGLADPPAWFAFDLDDLLWQGTDWRARLALRELLIAVEVLADGL